MTRPVLLFLTSVFTFSAANVLFGFPAVYRASYGAFTFLAVIIAFTFFWLWYRRSTPLALGMAFGWFGAGTVMGWWWLYDLFEHPAVMVQSSVLFICLSLYFVGALLHLEVIGRSFGMSSRMAYVALTLVLAVSVIITLLSQ